MKNLKYIFPFVIFATLFSLVSCSDDEEDSTNAPVITFVSITPSTATESSDEIEISIKYEDSDGDLGENDASVKNLFVLDTRNNVEYSFRVQQLAPDNSTVSIEGSLKINIGTMVITNGSASESATFSIYMKDRAGNTSNAVTSSAITVVQ